jgi:MYXO-CTERM domain-containing protein
VLPMVIAPLGLLALGAALLVVRRRRISRT